MAKRKEKQQIILSRLDTQAFLERNFEEKAAEDVFNAALTKYHNILTSLKEAELFWWEHAAEAYGLDIGNRRYKCRYDTMQRRYVIEEVDDA